MKEYKQKTIQRITIISIIGATFSVILGFLLLSKNISHILSVWGESNKLIVYLESEADSELISDTQVRLENSSGVEKVVYFTKEKAIEDFNAQISGYMAGLQNDKSLLQVIPSYFEVFLSPSSTLAELNSRARNLALEIQGWNGIDDVSYGSLWTEKYARLSQAVNGFFVFLGLILFSLSFFVVSSSIKSHLFQRSKEIEILEMIGATRFYIQKPIFIESLIIILTSFGIGICVNSALFFYFNSFFSNQLKLLNLSEVFQFFNVLEVLSLLGVSLSVGLFVTRWTFSRVYRSRSA